MTPAELARGMFHLEETNDLDLTHAFACEVGDVTDLLEGDAAAFGNIERAGVSELPRLEVRKV